MKTKILMVDDEPEIINAYRRLFFSFKNVWEINFATSGAEAIEFLKNNEVDVVVSDMRMPGMNGDELLRIIQSSIASAPPSRPSAAPSAPPWKPPAAPPRAKPSRSNSPATPSRRC